MMAKEAGVIHVQFDAGKWRGETHFPVQVSFWSDPLKKPVKFVIEDVKLRKTTGVLQSDGIEEALKSNNIPPEMVATLGADNTASITAPGRGAAALFNQKMSYGGADFAGCIIHKHDF